MKAENSNKKKCKKKVNKTTVVRVIALGLAGLMILSLLPMYIL